MSRSSGNELSKEPKQDWLTLCDERISPVTITPREKQEPDTDEKSEFLTLSEIRKLMKQRAEDHD